MQCSNNYTFSLFPKLFAFWFEFTDFSSGVFNSNCGTWWISAQKFSSEKLQTLLWILKKVICILLNRIFFQKNVAKLYLPQVFFLLWPSLRSRKTWEYEFAIHIGAPWWCVQVNLPFSIQRIWLITTSPWLIKAIIKWSHISM